MNHVPAGVLKEIHQIYWSFCLLFKTHKTSWKSNRVEKSLCHVAMVAKFLDDNKPKISLKKWIRTVSNFDDLIQFHLICQMMAKFSGVKSERTVSKFRKRIRKFLRCACLLRKAGAWNLDVLRCSRVTTAKKRTKKRDARPQLLCWHKPIAFFQFSLPSLASLLKLPIVLMQKFCYHGNVTSDFSSAKTTSRTERGWPVHRYLRVSKHSQLESRLRLLIEQFDIMSMVNCSHLPNIWSPSAGYEELAGGFNPIRNGVIIFELK